MRRAATDLPSMFGSTSRPLLTRLRCMGLRGVSSGLRRPLAGACGWLALAHSVAMVCISLRYPSRLMQPGVEYKAQKEPVNAATCRRLFTRSGGLGNRGRCTTDRGFEHPAGMVFYDPLRNVAGGQFLVSPGVRPWGRTG